MRRIFFVVVVGCLLEPVPGQEFEDVIAVARTKVEAGQWKAALELLLPLRDRLELDEDADGLAVILMEVGSGLYHAADFGSALRAFEVALPLVESRERARFPAIVPMSLTIVAVCLEELGRPHEALPKLERVLELRRLEFGDRDHLETARALGALARCLESVGRADEALPKFELALAMRRRMVGAGDHGDVARDLSNVGFCLTSLGRGREGLPRHEEALAMRRRLHADADHDEVANSHDNLAHCLRQLGRRGDALLHYETALAMNRRLFAGRDHPDVARSLNNVGCCLGELGRPAEALPWCEHALAMNRRIFGEAGHPDVAMILMNVANYLSANDQVAEALVRYDEVLAINRQLFGDTDHPNVATALNNAAACLLQLGRREQALAHFEASLAMRRRLCGDVDHPALALGLSNRAGCLESLGRAAEALPLFEAALSMTQRLYGDCDHPEIASGLNRVACCLQSLDRGEEALPPCERAVAMIERLRDESRTSPILRQSLFDQLKRDGAFERLLALAARYGRPRDSVYAAERGRGRELLDVLEQRFDPLTEAEQRAKWRGDDAAATRLATLRAELDAATFERDRLVHLLTRLGEGGSGEVDRGRRQLVLRARADAASRRQRQLLDERARLLGDVLPVGRVRTAPEIQAALRPDELLLLFTIANAASFVHVLGRAGEAEAFPLPEAGASLERVLPELLRCWSRSQVAAVRGRDAEPRADDADSRPARELFDSLIPGPLWQRLRLCKRVFVAAHRRLHRLPFEALVVEVKDGRPVRWLDAGPPVSYVPSGSVLQWLRQRAQHASDDATSLDLLAVGDPGLATEVMGPAEGAFVSSVQDGGEGARVGLLSRDVLTTYDGERLVDDTTLRDARMRAEAAIEDGKRADEPIPVGVWRRGAKLQVEVRKGPLGIQVAKGNARFVWEASLHGDAGMARIARHGDLERLRDLLPLLGARAETQNIEDLFAKGDRKTKRLLGADATEPAVFDLATKAKYLHFACHGIAEEYAGSSFSMLVLSQPEHVLPEDDGLLKLDDLFTRWRGRLSSCRLVVLSACRTNVGPTLRDDAPQALPLGFLFAGAPAVISSLWAVDDASTKELMTDFYRRLLAGETDKIAAFTAAKKALRAKYPDPFHWAPFLFVGSPD